MNLRTPLALLLAIACIYAALRIFDIGPMSYSKAPESQPVSTTPVQEMLDSPKVFDLNGYHITEVASYSVTARVLSHERYHFDRESDLSPIDLALGWGLMANKKVLSQISVSQGGRFYSWYAQQYPIPPEQIISSSANTHIIPATKEVKRVVESLRRGEFVTLKGRLVNVTAADGWHWNTSLSRNDDGAGACELFYVESAEIP